MLAADPPLARIAAAPSTRGEPGRLAALDTLRGVAILGMVAFHLHWDLGAFGLVAPGAAAEFGWFVFGRLVTCLFLGLVGVNLVLATRQGLRPRPFLRRLAVIAASAAAVSLGTWLAQPDGYVRFGILHCIALSSLLALPLLRAPGWVVAAVAAGLLAGREWLAGLAPDAAGWGWYGWYALGLARDAPWAPDYVPLFPWFGVVLLGLLAGGALVRALPGRAARGAGRRGEGRLARALRWAGRRSLPIYLLHQPLLVGALSLAAPLLAPALPAATTEALAAAIGARYVSACEADGHAPAACRDYAACVLDRLPDRPALLRAADRHSLSAEQAGAWQDAVDACAARLPPG